VALGERRLDGLVNNAGIPVIIYAHPYGKDVLPRPWPLGYLVSTRWAEPSTQ
jgi:hypothetical protein